MEPVDSGKYFEKLWLCWTAMGVPKVSVRYKKLFVVYAIIVTAIGALGYPVHLWLAFLTSATLADNLKNASHCVVITACSIKFVLNTMQLAKVREAEAIFRLLDARIITVEEARHFRRIGLKLSIMAYLFLSFYFAIGLCGTISISLKSERSLLIPGWFPFDWRDSNLKYFLANLYQIVGLCCHLTMNYVNDVYPPMALCLLAEHLSLLGIRISKLGYDCTNLMENELELRRCIRDQKHLYKLYNVLQEIMSLPVLIQFAVTAFNMCFSLSAMLFFVDAIIDRLYYFSYFISTILQIFPACYFGSNLQILFAHLHYDVYFSNWTEQSPAFKKNMIILTERSQMPTVALAGGMFRIHLDFFFSTVKGTYSLFAIIMRMRK